VAQETTMTVCGCGTIMAVKQNGVLVEEFTMDGRPYRLWSGDEYSCPNCLRFAVANIPRLYICDAYHPEYPGLVAEAKHKALWRKATTPIPIDMATT
jgi:hypothetical protein